VRLGLMIGPEKGRYRDKVAKLIEAAVAAEQGGFASIWVPQIPSDFDALTAIALMGTATSRIELATAVMPIQTRHPVAMAQQVLSNQAVCEGRFTLGLGPSHHWIVEDMLGLSYDRPAHQVRTYLEVLNVALAGPGPVDVENDTWRIHNPLDITDVTPTPILLAALAPLMLKIAGTQTDGTILWMADERAIGSHIAPTLHAAAAAAGRPTPRIQAGIPVCLCRDDEIDVAIARTNRVLSEAEVSPNYQKLLDQGDATTVGDLLAAGSEASIEARIRSFEDAGTTDISFRVVPIGENRDELIASSTRTREYLASLTSSR